jgi:serine/threonine-protein kinase
MQGTPVGSYVITGQIGEGGMGVVYAANHALLGRPAAIKVLLPEFSRNQDIVNRFFNEARAATAIRHPGIVEIYDFGYLGDGSAYIAMELLDGQALAARLAARRTLPANEALWIVRQIAGALGAAHARQIVHRDLKPDNVFLVRDPEVPTGERIKLLDFGIAKLAGDGTPQSQRTRTGAVMGTPTYMAPEQCRGVAVDHRADLYSLGCILFEMLCGAPPYVGEGVGDVLAAHIHVPVPSPRARVPDLPVEVEAFVMRLLAKDPAQRPQHAEQLIAEIDALGPVIGRPRTSPLVSAPTIAASPPTYTTGAPTTLSGSAGAVAQQTQPPPSRSRAPLFAGVGAMVVAAGVAIAFLAGGDDKKAEPAPEPQAAKVEEPPKPEPPPPPPPEPKPEPKPAMITLTIDSVPQGAMVLDGDLVLGKTPLSVEREKRQGTRNLRLELEDHKDATLDVAAGIDATETVKLSKIKAPKPEKKPKPKPKEKGDRNESVNPFDY